MWLSGQVQGSISSNISVPEQAKDYSPEELEHWIKNYFAARSFNICEQQPLQAMTGPPLKINVENGEKPVELH